MAARRYPRMPLVLSRAMVLELLRMEDCIDVLRDAHIAFSQGRAIMPVRLVARFTTQV